MRQDDFMPNLELKKRRPITVKYFKHEKRKPIEINRVVLRLGVILNHKPQNRWFLHNLSVFEIQFHFSTNESSLFKDLYYQEY